MIKMPPQAYTKEVLAAAFDWLAVQPEHIREKIKSSNDLVGLYLKSTRLKGEEANQNLSSAKNFRNELQDLAQNLKQFEEKEDKPETVKTSLSARTTFNPRSIQIEPSLDFEESQGREIEAGRRQVERQMIEAQETQVFVESPQPKKNFQPAPEEPITQEKQVEAPAPKPNPKPQPSEAEIFFRVDEKTKAALELAKDRLNLSSDSEALRVLVSLGAKHFKKLFGNEE